jgi:hypothetical protein
MELTGDRTPKSASVPVFCTAIKLDCCNCISEFDTSGSWIFKLCGMWIWFDEKKSLWDGICNSLEKFRTVHCGYWHSLCQTVDRSMAAESGGYRVAAVRVQLRFGLRSALFPGFRFSYSTSNAKGSN